MKNKRTYTPKKAEKERGWHFVDASGEILGRLATDIAKKLTGKDKPTFSYHTNVGDKVVVTNAKHIEVTGKKLKDKTYYKHTGYPGGIRSETLEKLLKRKPEEVIRKAVKGMLPKNKLQKERMKNLYVYAGSEHPHTAHQK